MSWLSRIITLPKKRNSISDLMREDGEIVRMWLAGPALVLPAATVTELSNALNLEPSVIRQVNAEVQKRALEMLAKVGL